MVDRALNGVKSGLGAPGGHQRSRTIRHRSRVASALVPADHITPSESQYIGRSTTICAGTAPTLSTTAPNRRCDPGGKAAAKWSGGRMFVRLFGGNATVVSTGAVPSSNNKVTFACPTCADVFAIVR